MVASETENPGSNPVIGNFIHKFHFYHKFTLDLIEKTKNTIKEAGNGGPFK